jgi:hypothetical protein
MSVTIKVVVIDSLIEKLLYLDTTKTTKYFSKIFDVIYMIHFAWDTFSDTLHEEQIFQHIFQISYVTLYQIVHKSTTVTD